MSAAIATLPDVAVPARLPMPPGATARGMVDVIFPAAKSPESILMAVDYCVARKLDVLKKPVHIVPVWSAALQREVETIWPGINEIQITAARTQAWAGMDSPRWGPTIRRVFKGSRKHKDGWKPEVIEVHYPEWCEITVYRLVGGQPRAFSEPVFWEEAYSTIGGKTSELPTDMWARRPRGQLHKVAKAAALRAAFPEEGELCAEEMEGKVIEAGGAVIEHEAAPELAPPPPPMFAVAVPYGGEPVMFPRNRGGAKEALGEISKMFNDKYFDIVTLNLPILDQIATRFPDLAEEISELRADAAEALRPKDEPDPNAEGFAAEFVNHVDDDMPDDAHAGT
jgi:phage recombination protein Bet